MSTREVVEGAPAGSGGDATPDATGPDGPAVPPARPDPPEGPSATRSPATRRRTGAPTIRQVAAAAGVSRATASRAINGGHLVSPEARAKVEAAIAELGFTPNPTARNLATRRTRSVALVVPEPNARLLSDPFFASVINGLSLSLEDADLQMLLVIARPGAGHERAVRYLSAGHVDGAVIASHHRTDTLNTRVVESGLPVVFVGRPLEVPDAACVDMDNVGGARMATEHLLASGRRRIATIAGPGDMVAGVDRLTGWRAALEDAGLPTDLVAHGDFTMPGGAEAMRRLREEHPDVDAVFVASDLMAAGAIAELRAQGVRVPDDVAVMGFDDIPQATATEPPLSTVHHPVERMAARAGAMLVEMLADPEAHPTPVLFEPTLVLRASA